MTIMEQLKWAIVTIGGIWALLFIIYFVLLVCVRYLGKKQKQEHDGYGLN